MTTVATERCDEETGGVGPPPRPMSAKPKLGRPVQGKALAKAGIAAPPPELARQPLGVNSPRK